MGSLVRDNHAKCVFYNNGKENCPQINWQIQTMRTFIVLSNLGCALLAHQCTFGKKFTRVGLFSFCDWNSSQGPNVQKSSRTHIRITVFHYLIILTVQNFYGCFNEILLWQPTMYVQRMKPRFERSLQTVSWKDRRFLLNDVFTGAYAKLEILDAHENSFPLWLTYTL